MKIITPIEVLILLKHSGIDFSTYSAEDLIKLWRATLEKGMHGICFSMYEDGQKPGDTITEAQVERTY